jgi:uncharacterized damage-inducible protein DinB
MKNLITLFSLLVLVAAPAAAQDTRAELASAYSMTESKLLAMAGALTAEQLAWRPAEGVRSASEVLNHVAGANYMLTSFVGCSAPEGADAPASFEGGPEYEGVSDVAVIKARLTASVDLLQSCAAGLSDEQLAGTVEWFGMSGSGQTFMYFVAGHMHEHVGQLIAYLRMNGVTPPWNS